MAAAREHEREQDEHEPPLLPEGVPVWQQWAREQGVMHRNMTHPRKRRATLAALLGHRMRSCRCARRRARRSADSLARARCCNGTARALRRYLVYWPRVARGDHHVQAARRDHDQRHHEEALNGSGAGADGRRVRRAELNQRVLIAIAQATVGARVHCGGGDTDAGWTAADQHMGGALGRGLLAAAAVRAAREQVHPGRRAQDRPRAPRVSDYSVEPQPTRLRRASGPVGIDRHAQSVCATSTSRSAGAGWEWRSVQLRTLGRALQTIDFISQGFKIAEVHHDAVGRVAQESDRQDADVRLETLRSSSGARRRCAPTTHHVSAVAGLARLPLHRPRGGALDAAAQGSSATPSATERTMCILGRRLPEHEAGPRVYAFKPLHWCTTAARPHLRSPQPSASYTASSLPARGAACGARCRRRPCCSSSSPSGSSSSATRRGATSSPPPSSPTRPTPRRVSSYEQPDGYVLCATDPRCASARHDHADDQPDHHHHHRQALHYERPTSFRVLTYARRRASSSSRSSTRARCPSSSRGLRGRGRPERPLHLV